MYKKCLRLFSVFILSALCFDALAEQKKVFDGPEGSEYELHYIALNSTFLEPDIAKQYGLIRSKAMGLVNISLIQVMADGTRKATKAIVQGLVTNEIQQQNALSFKQVIEGPATYYLAQAQYAETKPLRFDIQIFAPGVSDPLLLRFSHAFFND